MTLLPGREIPAGTHLEIRLTAAVGTYASKPGSTVSAVLTAPVIAGERVLLPAGSRIAGEVKSVRRVGLGIVHETAELELEFQRATLPDSTTIPISARVIEVDNARERVAKDGRIYEQRSTGSLSHRASGYIRMAVGLNVHAQLGIWAVKQLSVDFPLEPLPVHGKRMERFARREILSMRNELIRNNSYWRSYEAIRFAVATARRHKGQEVELSKAEPKALEKVTGFVALR